MMVLVLGATGFVGRALVPALVAAGERVRAASRRAVHDSLGAVEWVQCDVRAHETLPAAFAGVDCAYYLVHSMGAGQRDFRAIEQRSAASVARVAAESGVSRLVYLGGVEPHSAPSEHLASRLDVGAILRSEKVATIELRAAMIVGNGSTSWQILRDLALRLPIMVLPRWLESKSSPLALPDVVTALLDARTIPLAGSAWFDIPGPELLSAREMLMIVADIDRRRIPAVRVPLLTPRLSAAWLKLVSHADYDVARELVLGLREDLLPRDEHYWKLTGHTPNWTFRAAAEHALITERRERGLTAWLGRQEERAVRNMFARPRSRAHADRRSR
jgi:uncharacterized protein YbjT (DUF2867 family)